MTSIALSLRRVALAVLRVVVLFAGLVFTFSLMLAGAMALSVLVVWNLLRGRRPLEVRWKLRPGMVNAAFFRAGPGPRARAAAQARRDEDNVVDVPAREVTPPGRQIDRD